MKRLIDFLNEADENKNAGTDNKNSDSNNKKQDSGKKKPETVKISVTIDNVLEDAKKIYNSNKDLETFLSRIKKPKLSNDKKKYFIYRITNKTEDKIEEGELAIYFNKAGGKQPSDEFKKIVDAIKTPKPTEWENILKNGAKELGNGDAQDFITTFFISKVSNPAVTPAQSKDEHISDLPRIYEEVGESMVYRAGECVSKLADADTKINANDFQDVLQSAFGSATNHRGESDAFLSQFTRMREKMKIDAAKYAIYVINQNGDTDSEENESYYDSLIELLPLLMEAEEDKNNVVDFIELPKKVSDFVNNDMKKALIQANNVSKKYPRQYNICYKQLESSFEAGLKKGQDAERDDKKTEFKDPITGKIIKRHGKAWGTGGPNGFIRDNPWLEKLCNDIKGQKWTIFNCVGKTVLKIFDILETGGKMYQKFCDDLAEGFKQIKQSFGSMSTADFDKQAEQYSKNGEENKAISAEMASVIYGLTRIYQLLGEGKIGIINGKYKTVTTIDENNTTVIQNAVNQLADSIAKYSKKQDEYERWKEEKNKETDEKIKKFEEQIKQLEDGRKKENPNSAEKQNNANNATETQQGSEKKESTFIDTSRPYLNEIKKVSLKSLLKEEEEAKKEETEKNDIQKEIEDQKKELEKLKKSKNEQVQINLETYFALLDAYSDASEYIGQIADIHSFLVKMFDENEAKDQYAKMFNKKENEDSEEGDEEEDTTTEHYSYKLNIKNPFINEAEEFEVEDDDEEDNKNEDDSTDNKNDEKEKEDKAAEQGQEGNLDWIQTGAGKNLVELYRLFGVNTQKTLLDISALKSMAKEKNQDNILKNFATITDSLSNVLNETEINPIKDGIIAFDYAFGEDADENKFKTLANAFELEGFGNNEEDEKKKKEDDEKKKKEQEEERKKNGVWTLEELEEKQKELAALVDNSSKIMKHVSEINKFVQSANDDKWLDEYANKIKESEELENEIWEKCLEIYNDKNEQNKKGNQWLLEKRKSTENQVYLNKLWITLSSAKNIGQVLKKTIEDSKKNEKKESIFNTNKYFIPLLLEEDDKEQENTNNTNNNDNNNESNGTRKRHNAEMAVNVYKDNLSKIDFNELLPTDLNNAVYDITKGKEYNDLEQKFAHSKLGFKAENDANLPKGILKNILGDPKTEPTELYNKLKPTCEKIMEQVIYGHVSKNLKGDDRDIYLSTGCMVGVCKSLEKLKNTPAGQEDHRGISTAKSDMSPEGVKTTAGTEKEQTGNAEKPQQNNSYIIGRSNDSLINEIYKYIKGN